MTRRITLAAASLSCMVLPAAAQSAGVTVASSAPSVAPGGSVTITLEVDFNTGGAGGGLFGDAGLYGFGGDVTVSGPSTADVNASNIAVDAMLDFGLHMSTPGDPVIVRAAVGRGLNGGLMGSPVNVLMFDLTADGGAAEGSVTLDFDGAVVLVEDSNLVTYATVPGLNQQMLTTASVTVTIGEAGCNDADVAEPFGLLDLADINAFISGFLAQDLISDLSGDGLLDLTDINLFISAFLAGCP